MFLSYEPGDFVINPKNKGWGIGQIQSIINHKVTVNFENEGKKVVLLPGPPKEMKPMAKNELLPYILDDDKVIFSEQLKFAGIGESKVETIL